MKRRIESTGDLPPAVARGPFEGDWPGETRRQQRAAWVMAGQAWALQQGIGANAWKQLLPEPVRTEQSDRARLRELRGEVT